MTGRPPLLVRAILRGLAVVAWLVPRPDRENWRREWEAEVLHRDSRLRDEHRLTFPEHVRLARRASGSLADAAWLRRQFTRDSEVIHDARHAWRVIRRRPANFLVAAAMLAVGIGSTTAVLLMMDRLVVRALPFEDADRLVSFRQRNAATGNLREEIAPANFLDWRASTTSFEAIAASEPYSVDYTGGGPPEVLLGTQVTDGFFDLLRVKPLHGRVFGPKDFQPGADSVAIISYTLWRRLGADPAIGSRAITLDGQPHTIIGVLPPRADLNLFDGRDRRDVFLPKVFEDYERELRGSGWWAAIGRLKDGVSREQAQAELDVVSARLAQAYPRTNRTTTAGIEPLETNLMRTVRPALTLMLVAAVLVLLVSCANVASLQFVRWVERLGEFDIREALGASRPRLMRQMLAESGLLAFVGTASGIGVAWLTIRVSVLLAPVQSPRLSELTLDGDVVALAALVGISATLLTGLVPALQFFHGGRRGKGDSPRSTMGMRARRLRDILVAAEVAVAVMLAAGVGLLGRSFEQLLRVDPGFKADRLAVVQVFASDRNETPEKLSAFFEVALSKIREIPGVVRAGAVSTMPFIEANINMEAGLFIVGRPPAAAGEGLSTFVTVATPEYFPMMRIPVESGRALAPQDRRGATPVAVISRSLARKHWPGGDPLGSEVEVLFQRRPIRVRIVGVVGSVRHDGLQLPPRDELFLPHAQVPLGSMTFVLESAGDPGPTIEPAKVAIWSVDPLQTFYDSGIVRDLLSTSVAPRRFTLVMTGVYAVVALGLAALGIYGVLAAAARQRTREIGVRLALGASPGTILRLLIARAVSLGGVGMAIGLAGAVLIARSLRAQLFGVTPFDPVTIAGVVGVVAVAVSLAAYGPARRALKVDPVRALRE